ncbi:unnamed protein product [Peniophora sp. CBMAI 1063]|nr:unnamed protein product [Peniophora sp. CBMAI 1063]
MSSERVSDEVCLRYEPVEVLGVGSFGTVEKCTVHAGDEQLPGFVARKTISWGEGSSLNQEEVLYEKEALEGIAPHDGIVQLLDSWVSETELYLVFDYCENSDLLNYASAHPLDNDTLWSIHVQVMEIIRHIHSQGYIFFDVKLENILVVEANPIKVKFADFGGACPVEELGLRPLLSSRVYAAPEIRNPRLWPTIGPECDYFAWNISLFVLAVTSRFWQGGGPTIDQCLTSFLGGSSRTLHVEYIPAQNARESLFLEFLTEANVSSPEHRARCMSTHRWVTEVPASVSTAEGPIPSSASTISTASSPPPQVSSPTQRAGRHVPARSPSAPQQRARTSSPEPSARRASTKRTGVEKCLEKEKVGKSSGVGSTAGRRVASARKKAAKTCSMSPVPEAGGPAQAVLKLRATRPRRSYKY